MSLLKNHAAIITEPARDSAARNAENAAAAGRRSRAVFDASPDGILIMTDDGALVEVNAAAREMIDSRSPAAAAPASIFELALPEYRAALRMHLDDVLTGTAGSIEFEIDGSGGVRRRLEARMVPFHDGPAALLAVCRDITEHRRMEVQLRYAQKMEAIGTLSGGIAHDFNNILTAIIGYANILKLKLKQEDPLRPHVDQILASSERATALTQSILAFSRKTAVTLRRVSINETVQRVENQLRRILGDGIAFKTTLTSDDTTSVADTGQIEQSLMNLAANARDAMPEGGAFSVNTEIRELGSDFIRTYGYGNPGRYVVITLSDTGCGMDEKTKTRIFEPFFTTKEIGKGTGLGLSIVYGIVKQHHGYINCFSEQGHGTTFDLYLPLARPTAFEPSVKATFIPSGGTETILLAEDDPEERNLAATYLRDFGYTVVEAENGNDAMRLFAEHREAIRLLLFDIVMPKRDGRDAYEGIRALSPDIKILFMSGQGAVSSNGKSAGELECILKPVSPETLLNKVREVLDR